MKTLNIHHEKSGQVDILALDGILNADTNIAFDELLQPLSDQELPMVLIDASKLAYISSAGIGCFIGSIKKIRNKGGDIRFSCMAKKIKRVFEMLDMADFFKFFSDIDKALASFDAQHKPD